MGHQLQQLAFSLVTNSAGGVLLLGLLLLLLSTFTMSPDWLAVAVLWCHVVGYIYISSHRCRSMWPWNQM